VGIPPGGPADVFTTDPLQLLLVNAGVSGVVVVLIIVGWLWAKPSVTREFEKADAADRQKQALIDTLLAVYHSEVLPTLTDVDKRLIPLLEETQKALNRTVVLLDRQEREWDWRERRGRVEEEAPSRRLGGDAQGGGRGGGGQGQRPAIDPPYQGRPR
jgi:hypothetical protein